MLSKDEIRALFGIITGLVFVFGFGVGIKIYDVTAPMSDNNRETSTLPIETYTPRT